MNTPSLSKEEIRTAIASAPTSMDAVLDEALDESFPASDPPSHSAMTRSGPPAERIMPEQAASNAMRRRGSSASWEPALAGLSLAAGAVDFFAAEAVAKWFGLKPSVAKWIRLVGAREIATGIMLARPRTAALGARARVVGDAVDAAALLIAIASSRSKRGPLVGALAFVGVAAALDVAAASRQSKA